MKSRGPSDDRGLQEAPRAAAERTPAATAASAPETRGRTQELLDDATHRGQEARDASASVTRIVEVIGDLRPATRGDLRAPAHLERRLSQPPEAHPQPEVEVEKGSG